MKESEYKKVMDEIKARPGVKEEIWERLIEESQTKHPGKVWKYAVAAVAGLCVMICSYPAVASGIRSLLMREMPYYNEVAQSVEEGIFSETDGHILVSVEELLSDGMGVYMTVKYTAQDETGKQWLKEYEPKQVMGSYDLSLVPDMGDWTVSKTNYSYATMELADHAGEEERLFLVKMESSSRDYEAGKGIFYFPMTEGRQETVLDISGNVEVRAFKLSDEESPSQLYTPSFIEISPMSFVIYAYNHGVFERKTEGDYSMERWLMPAEEIDALEDNSYFVMKDGSKEMLPPGGHTTTYPKAENLNSDVVLYHGMFVDYTEKGNPVAKIMNLDEIEAVVIGGVRYEFEK